ncbi:MAG: hypothetical protein CMO66_05150 [Verrucomicrobiales bacterium]|nr:hypothetical protein [Verrucomicrobiales bacterium]|tara:strand:+ start:703 stop:1716 length:1014 start_codon:yes stop_codon:yes gene_type:complete
MQIHINRNGQQFGPYTREEVQAYLGDGSLSAEDWAWHEGMGDWQQLNQINLGLAASTSVASSDVEIDITPEATTPVPAQAAPSSAPGGAGGGVSAESAMERLRKLQRGNMPTKAKPSARRDPKAKGAGKTGAKGAQPADVIDAAPAVPKAKGQTIAMAAIGICVLCGAGYAAMKFFDKDEDAPPKIIVPDAVTNDAEQKLQKLNAQVTRDQDDQINGIRIAGINITTNGWKVLVQLKNIQKLDVTRCGIDDMGAVNLRQFAHLQRLNISSNQLTDKSVVILKELSRLRFLNLKGNKMTKNGVATIRAALPNCIVEHGVAPVPPGPVPPPGKAPAPGK